MSDPGLKYTQKILQHRCMWLYPCPAQNSANQASYCSTLLIGCANLVGCLYLWHFSRVLSTEWYLFKNAIFNIFKNHRIHARITLTPPDIYNAFKQSNTYKYERMVVSILRHQESRIKGIKYETLPLWKTAKSA